MKIPLTVIEGDDPYTIALKTYLDRAYYICGIMDVHIRTLEKLIHDRGLEVPKRPYGVRRMSDVKCGIDIGSFYLNENDPENEDVTP